MSFPRKRESDSETKGHSRKIRCHSRETQCHSRERGNILDLLLIIHHFHMKNKTLGYKLYYRRKLLGHSQLYLATKVGMTQSALSFIENGQTKFTDELVQKFKAIENYEDFDVAEIEKVDPFDTLGVIINEPWVMCCLILAAFVAIILYLNFLFVAAEDAARGYVVGEGREFANMVFTFTFILVAINVIFVYAVYRLIKLWWKRRRMGIKVR